MRRVCLVLCTLCLLTSSVRAESASDRFDRGLGSTLDWIADWVPDNTDAAVIGTALGLGGLIGGHLAADWAAVMVGAAAANGGLVALAGVGGVVAGAGLGLAVVAGGTALYNWLRRRDFDGDRLAGREGHESDGSTVALLGHQSASTAF